MSDLEKLLKENRKMFMACMGPSQEAAYRDADKAFEEIWKLLQEKYHIRDAEKPLKDGTLWKSFFYDDCVKSKQDLRNALREVFWNDACDAF